MQSKFSVPWCASSQPASLLTALCLPFGISDLPRGKLSVLCERQCRHTNTVSVNKVLNWAGLLNQAQDTNCLNTPYQENIYSYQHQMYTFVWIEGIPLQRVFQPLGYHRFQQNFQRTWELWKIRREQHRRAHPTKSCHQWQVTSLPWDPSYQP